MSDNISAPNIVQLSTELVEVNEWYHFGVALGVPPSKLQKIKEESPQGTVERWKIDMFQYWLGTTPSASWKDIIAALETIDRKTLSAKLEKRYIPITTTTSDVTDEQVDCSTYTKLSTAVTAKSGMQSSAAYTDMMSPATSTQTPAVQPQPPIGELFWISLALSVFWSLVCAPYLLLCTIPALFFARQSTKEMNRRNARGARKKALHSLYCIIASVVCGLIALVIFVIVVYLATLLTPASARAAGTTAANNTAT